MLKSVHVPGIIRKTLPFRGIFYGECLPSPELRSLVAWYWMLRFDNADYPVKTTPPDGGADIVIPLNDPGDPILFGQSACHFPVPEERSHNIFGIRLHPGAAHALFSVSASELYDAAVPLSGLLSGREFSNWPAIPAAEGISGSESFASACRTVDRWLCRYVRLREKPDSRVSALLALSSAAMPSDITVDRVAASLALSPRQLERTFKRVCGLTPKSFLRVRRFQTALALKEGNDQLPWSELSQNCGYYDQSHMCREFREFTALSPQDYFSLHTR